MRHDNSRECKYRKGEKGRVNHLHCVKENGKLFSIRGTEDTLLKDYETEGNYIFFDIH